MQEGTGKNPSDQPHGGAGDVGWESKIGSREKVCVMQFNSGLSSSPGGPGARVPSWG